VDYLSKEIETYLVRSAIPCSAIIAETAVLAQNIVVFVSLFVLIPF